ncbi:MAG: hypothetical protein K0U19_00395 [Proteobacteria bacterium]|nr:hypothetical protein [Pseudomonadota bacterium]
MITGSAKVRIDEKGRLAIPNRFREALNASNGLVLTMHPHKHLSLYKKDAFEALKEKLLQMPNIGYIESHLQEVIIGCAEHVSLDSAGRIMVQNNLRMLAAIERETLFFGVGESIHIWDEKLWEQRNLVLLSRLQDGELSEQWKQLKI